MASAVAVLIVFMTVVYAIGLWINIGTQNLVRQQIVEGTHLQLAELAARLDGEMDAVFRQQVALSNDAGLGRLALHDDFSNMADIFVQLRRLVHSFNITHHSSPHVSAVGVYLPLLNRISQWGLAFAPPNAHERRFLNAIHENEYDIFVDGSDLVLSISLHEGIHFRSAVIFTIFDGNAIAATLNQMAQAYGLTIALFYDGTKVLVAGSEMENGDYAFSRVMESQVHEPVAVRIARDSMWALRAGIPRFNFELVALLPNIYVDAVVIPTLVGTAIFFIVSMVIGVGMFAVYAHYLIKQVFQQKKASEEAQLGQLHLRITPHFLYNSFYQMYRLSKMGDVETVSEMSLKLSQYYQYITRSKDETATLSLEVKHVEDYVAVQNIRYCDIIECTIHPLPKECRDIKMPKLFLQPLVENAYIHGMDSAGGASRIDLFFAHENGRLLISVEDDGSTLDEAALKSLQQRLAETQAQEMSSMFNLSQRLQFMYGDAAKMGVSRSERGGLRVEIALEL